MAIKDDNQERNKAFYEKLYSGYSIKNILWWLNHLEGYLEFVTTTETSWFGLYHDDFRNAIEGKRVLEIGCGDCNNAAIMAALGAEVYANDIASSSGEIIKLLNENYHFKHPLKFVEGDFLNNGLPANSFDFVVGKAFLHHLTIPLERLFLKESARLLKGDGEARFFEPAVNNKVLDELRWHIPVGDRPSKFDKAAFKEWKKNDPHPDRTLSSSHFRAAGKEFFKKTEIIPIGSLERFRRLIPNMKLNAKFTRWALANEKSLPELVKLSFARSQLIKYSKPV